MMQDVSFNNDDDVDMNKLLVPLLCRQVVMLLSVVDRSKGYSITHRLTHRRWNVGTGLGDWAPGANHVPALTSEVYGLHAPRPL
jgi:calpain-15